MEDLNSPGWITKVAQVERIAGELDDHIKALSSLVDDLTVRQRVHVKGCGFGLMLDYVASFSRPSAPRSLSRFVFSGVTFSSSASYAQYYLE